MLLAALAAGGSTQIEEVIMTITDAMMIAVGIANLLAADIPSRISSASFATVGEVTSFNSAPSAASVAARVVVTSNSRETADDNGFANTAAMRATDMAMLRRARRDRSSSRARERRREMEPSGQPS